MEGKFVYAWNKDRLVLLPSHSEDYKRSMSFTDLQGKKVGAKELVAGVTYITRQQEELVYLGKFDYHFVVEYTRNHYYGRVNSYDTDYYKKLGYDVTKEFNEPSKADAKGVNKRFVFWNGKKKLIALSSINSIAQAKDDSIHPDYAAAVDRYNKSAHGSKVVKLFLKDVAKNNQDDYSREHWFFEDDDGSFVECYTYYGWNRSNKANTKPKYVQAQARYYIDEKTGLFIKKDYSAIGYRPGSTENRGYRQDDAKMKYREPTNLRLYAETENGSVLRVVAKDNHSAFDRKEVSYGED